jgi:hypothetical protein
MYIRIVGGGSGGIMLAVLELDTRALARPRGGFFERDLGLALEPSAILASGERP